MAKGTHFTKQRLYDLRRCPGDGTRWGQRICNEYGLSNPRLYYGDNSSTERWVEHVCADYQM